MKNKDKICKTIVLTLFLCFGVLFQLMAQLELKTDFTDSTQAKGVINYPLNVFNRISPIDGFRSPATAGAKLCIVRPLGGKYSNGGADLSLDTYLWDEDKKEFYTDFTLLKKQIDGVFNKGFGIHQIVLDNPSWAFQRDTLGNLESGELKISTYGNAEPPKDFNAWANYLKEVMQFLVATYGEEEVLKIQYGIGREIGTKGHWTGTKEQFFEFYKKSVAAIHEVLPEAKVGSHFLWQSSNYPWGADFVKWCKANEVHYDVVGVSYYPFYNKANRVNFKEVYAKDFGAIKDISEWNDDAVMEIHEFALIETMNAKGNGYESAAAKYQNSFMVGMMKMLYDKDIKNLAQWGTGTQYMPANKAVKDIEGELYYRSTVSGTPQSASNYVDAIFTKDTTNDLYHTMVYNYNASPGSSLAENLDIKATVAKAPGTNVKYRYAVYDSDNGTLPWSAWQYTKTQGEQADESTIRFSRQIPAFSFLKYEYQLTDEEPEKPDSAALKDKLILYYPLEEGAKDLSANANDGILGSAVTFTSGKVGNGASFSYAEGSYLSSADSVFKYSYPSAYTVAFWLKVNDYTQRADILQPAQGRTLLYSNGDLSFRTFHQKKSISFEVSEEEKDEWFHVAMVIDQREGQTQHKFFINGEQRGTIAQGYELETDKPQSISRLIFGSSSDAQLQRNFTGMLDEIYLFDGVLSNMEIKYVMDSKGLIEKSDDQTNISEIKRNTNMVLYPNPTNHTLTIKGIEVTTAELYNMMGVWVKSCKLSNNNIDVSSLANGMYMLKVMDFNGNSYFTEFIKQ